MSSLTKDKRFKKKNNKVETFLNKWKHKNNKKTTIQNKLNKQSSNKERTTHIQHSIDSSISSSIPRETCNNNTPSNQPSLKSPSTTLTKDPNNTPSSITNYSLGISPTWQPIISNTSCINA